MCSRSRVVISVVWSLTHDQSTHELPL
jgi:hypothetical protein